MEIRGGGGAVGNRRGNILAAFISLAVFAAGCAAGPHHSLAPEYSSRLPRSVAVLPVLNESVNLKAPDVLRPIVLNKLSMKGYGTPALSSIDGRLLEKEVREAGEVHSLTPQELGSLLGVDAVLYTTITEFNTTFLLAYASMTVGARFELKDSKTGERLWEAEHQVKDSKLGLDSKSVGDAVQFAFAQSYAPYCQQVVDVSFTTLPNGPRAPPAPAAGCLMPAF